MSEELDIVTSGPAALPSWWTEMQATYLAGKANVFVLHGAINDYVEHRSANLSLREYLEQRLARLHAVATYAPDQGVTLPGPDPVAKDTQRWIQNVLGIEAAAPDPGAFNPLAALAAAGGAAGPATGELGIPSDAPNAIQKLLEWGRGAVPEGEAVPSRAVGPKDDRRTVAARAAIIVERADLILPPDDKARVTTADRGLLAALTRAGQAVQLNRNKVLVIILAPSLQEIHGDLLAGGIYPIEIGVPERDQRLAFIARTLPARRVELDGMTEGELANESAGLGRRHIEDIALVAAANGGKLTRDLVKSRKAELIKSEYAEVLEILEPDVSFEQVGGHERAKKFLQEQVLTPMRDPDLLKVCPMGIMFMGPAGTGKTFLARAIAHETGLNCVELDASKIKGQWVGESEKKLAKALVGIKALAPCVVFLDELDQRVKRVTGGSGGGGDSVESNTFGTLLRFFSDTSHRGQILLIAATNRPDQIDAAFRRPGRIDFAIPLLPPDEPSERALAVSALCRRAEMELPSEDELAVIGRATDGWTPAELEAMVVHAGRLTLLGLVPPPVNKDDTRSLSARAIDATLEDLVCSTADVEYHTELAIRACNFRSLVPAKYTDRVGKAGKRQAAQAASMAGVARQAITDRDAYDAYADDEE